MPLNAFGLCFTDATGGTPFQHDPALVALSFVVAAGGSYAALEMIERWRIARGGTALYWQLASAATLGGSIWSMHFIGMLALRIRLPLTYALAPTLLSLLIVIAIVGCGLQIMRQGATWRRIVPAGIIVGLGVATMHYVGMSAVRLPGSLGYVPSVWSLSLLVGIGAATSALWLSVTVRTSQQRAMAAFVMALAICAMHYTGMASTVFRFDPLASAAPGLPTGPLTAAVALPTLALILSALLFVASDRRLRASAAREAELLRCANEQLASANLALELGRQQFDATLSNMTQGVTFFDTDQKLIVCNRRFAEIYRLSPQQTRPGTTLLEILDHRIAAGSFPDMTREAYLARRERLSLPGTPYDVTDEFPDGRSVTMHYQPLATGGWVTTHEDITERRRTEADIAFMAQHDTLTRLPNRLLFRERLEQALATRGNRCAVLCLDLDHFKLVNDTLGHPAGDELLRAAADRLRACVRDGDTVARLGGDEFAIIQVAASQPYDAEALASRIIAAFAAPFELERHQLVAGTSIGIALAPADGSSFEKLLRNADIALYLAKTEGRGTARFFEPEMDARIQLRRLLELDLRAAVAREEFEVYYQPQIDLASGRIIGFEALLRWHHPTRGLVLPGAFVQVAEETGMIVPIGAWVLRTACRDAVVWPDEVRLAVNLSPLQFKSGDLIATVQAALDGSGLPAERLELEITESVLLQDNANTVVALHRLRAMGITVALDDFGTGYSSLSYLRSFPFDKIKIDQSFVRDLMTGREAVSIIRAIAALGHSLCMTTTAEGVETTEQLDRLRAEGCKEVQGYLFSRPRPASELPAMLAAPQRIARQSAMADAGGPGAAHTTR